MAEDFLNAHPAGWRRCAKAASRRAHSTILLLPITVAMVVLAGCQPEPGPGKAVDRSGKVDALFAWLTLGVQPGAAVMVISNGEIVHQGAYGYADLEKQLPITADSAFRLASVSKQFTATAVMVLAEDGALSYDDPISRWLPELAPYEGITVRHLLTHTGGLPEYYDVIDTRAGMPTNADALAKIAAIGEAAFAPGERYQYSNPGYDVLAQLVEAVTGKDFATFMQERVFLPAGMAHAAIFDQTEPEISQRAIGYAPDGNDFVLNDYDPLNHIVGSGGMYATLDDLYRWDQALYGDSVLPQPALEAAWVPARLSNGDLIDYGFGWAIDQYHGELRLRHGGSWVGFRTHIARYPEARLSVVILSNRADFSPGAYIDRITDIWLDRGAR